ncbi:MULTISPECIES: hypothetical protein [unclassified Butyrivibrio]|uniref:hypothetical protein n=1 Tax=unclassified Butyrivibrio TaxID=2639466 RepID=UPI0008767190|nr:MULTISPECIES: hypothetical protein [unclassified Butyrivibrio]SCY14685.1 hypothetical protein SAMN02910371_01216 [Butyrivibrio sp. INlla14]SDB52116.1 hypothetical protein SAMN02910263_02632 [Butyrivibrio sp. INlla16]
MSRDKSPYNAAEQEYISDVGKKYREYLRYKGLDYISYGKKISLEESSCKDYMYFPTILRPVAMREMFLDKIDMNWFLGDAEEMFRKLPANPTPVDYVMNFDNAMFMLDRSGSDHDKFDAGLRGAPYMGRWIEHGRDSQMH